MENITHSKRQLYSSGVQGAMSSDPDQPLKQQVPKLAGSSATEDQNQHLRRLLMSTTLGKPSGEYTVQTESLEPHFFSQISEEQGNARSNSLDKRYLINLLATGLGIIDIFP